MTGLSANGYVAEYIPQSATIKWQFNCRRPESLRERLKMKQVKCLVLYRGDG